MTFRIRLGSGEWALNSLRREGSTCDEPLVWRRRSGFLTTKATIQQRASRTRSGKAMRAVGEGTRELLIGTARADTDVLVTVQDSGPRMPERVFDHTGRPNVKRNALRFIPWIIQFICHQYQFSQRFCLHFSHHIATVYLHRDLGYAYLPGNLLVQTSGRNESHHLALALRQRIKTRPKQVK